MVPMTLDQVVLHYPRAYHMANAGSWESIRHRGLLSTTALLDLFRITGQQRYLIESCHRPTQIEIYDPHHDVAIIRDQVPMRKRALEVCLEGITTRGWYELLNRRVFFWVTDVRLETLLRAKLYRNKEHTVLTIDTKSLLTRHADRVTLSPINSGSTLYNPRSRGRNTFRSIAGYPFEERRRVRRIANAIAELAVDYSVPDMFSHTLAVERRRGPEVLEQLFPHPGH
jgi:hypothetical protein